MALQLVAISEGSSLMELYAEVFMEGKEGRSGVSFMVIGGGGSLDEPRLGTCENSLKK